jgi:hypothetical protein
MTSQKLLRTIKQNSGSDADTGPKSAQQYGKEDPIIVWARTKQLQELSC